MKTLNKLFTVILLVSLTFTSCSKDGVNDVSFETQNTTLKDTTKINAPSVNNVVTPSIFGKWTLVRECFGDICQDVGALSYDYVIFNQNNTVTFGRFIDLPKTVTYDFTISGKKITIQITNHNNTLISLQYNWFDLRVDGVLIINQFQCDKFGCDYSNIIKTNYLIKS